MKLTFKQLMEEYIKENINFDTFIRVYDREHISLEKDVLGNILFFHPNLENKLYEIVKPKIKINKCEYVYKERLKNNTLLFDTFVVLTQYDLNTFKLNFPNQLVISFEEIEVDND